MEPHHVPLGHSLGLPRQDQLPTVFFRLPNALFGLPPRGLPRRFRVCQPGLHRRHLGLHRPHLHPKLLPRLRLVPQLIQRNLHVAHLDTLPLGLPLPKRRLLLCLGNLVQRNLQVGHQIVSVAVSVATTPLVITTRGHHLRSNRRHPLLHLGLDLLLERRLRRQHLHLELLELIRQRPNLRLVGRPRSPVLVAFAVAVPAEPLACPLDLQQSHRLIPPRERLPRFLLRILIQPQQMRILTHLRFQLFFQRNDPLRQ